MVLYFVLRCCVLFWNLLVVFRCRIEFIENICRKLVSQYRPVGNDTCIVVDKRHAVDSANRINAEDCVDVFRFEQPPELFPRVMRAHGIFDCLSPLVERSRFFQFVFRHPVIL